MFHSWLRERTHPTWHFTAMCLGLLVGVTVAQWWNGFDSAAWIITAIILFVLAMWRKRRYMVVAAVMAGVILGIWRGSISQTGLAIYEKMYGQHVIFDGTIADDTDTNKRDQQVMRLKNLTYQGKSIEGVLWVTADYKPTLKRSDRLTIDGKLAPGFGNFAASIYQAKVVSVTRGQPGDMALNVRDGFADKIRAAISEPAASLGIGYLLGQKRSLPDDLVNALKLVGLTHIIVASGYNLTILVRLARRLFEKVSKYLAALTSIALIVGFIGMTGLSPSMSRAGLVSLLSLWAWYYGRKFHPVTLLLFAAAVTVVINPSYAWGDVGWQLSFAAFAGVLIVAPLAQRYFFGRKKPGNVRQIIGETISAQLMTAPIILVLFGQFSNIAPISNLLILPFVPLAMLLTFIAGLGGMIMPVFAHVIGWPAQTLLDAMVWVIKYCAAQEWAQSNCQVSWWVAAIFYAVVAMACLYMARKTKGALRESSIVE